MRPLSAPRSPVRLGSKRKPPLKRRPKRNGKPRPGDEKSPDRWTKSQSVGALTAPKCASRRRSVGPFRLPAGKRNKKSPTPGQKDEPTSEGGCSQLASRLSHQRMRISVSLAILSSLGIIRRSIAKSMDPRAEPTLSIRQSRVKKRLDMRCRRTMMFL